MLVLSLREGEEIELGADVKISVLDLTGGRVRVGITAPQELQVRRVKAQSAASAAKAAAAAPKDCRS